MGEKSIEKDPKKNTTRIGPIKNVRGIAFKSKRKYQKYYKNSQ